MRTYPDPQIKQLQDDVQQLRKLLAEIGLFNHCRKYDNITCIRMGLSKERLCSYCQAQETLRDFRYG